MKIVLFGGAFNPPGIHHREVARAARDTNLFDEVRVMVCGPRPDKPTTNDTDPVHRAVMADLTFRSLGKTVQVDLSDLELNTFTRTHELNNRYLRDGHEVWHLVGTDLIAGGKDGVSLIHRVWAHGPELWRQLNFVVAIREGTPYNRADFPPNHVLLHVGRSGSSEEIRRLASNHQSLEGLVVPAVAEYIERNNLYRGNGTGLGHSRLVIPEPRPLFVVDPFREEARAIAERLRPLFDARDPNCILTLGGDGTLLHGIRDHWRLRLPYIPVHLGTHGFLLNDMEGELNASFFDHVFTTLRSPMLHVEAIGRDGNVQESLAFNDAWMQVEIGKTGWFEVSVDGVVHFARLMADGVLAATAAGSTAYALAMGAKPIPIGTDNLVLVGSNVFDPPHWRKGANLPIGSLIQLRNLNTDGYRRTYGFADGKAFGEVDSMNIRVSRIAAPEIAYLDYQKVSDRVRNNQFSF